MTAQNLTRIYDSTGHVNTGPGNQYNVNVLVASMAELRAATQPGEALHWSTEHFVWLKQRFVEPEGFGEARETVRIRSAALVTGAPGSGRRTAALMLLVGGGEARDVRIRELEVKAEGRDEESWNPDLFTPGEGLLVDLTTVADRDYELVCSRINAFLGVLRGKGARLAIVDGHRRAPHTDLERLRVEIGRPDGRAVLLRYLRAERLLPLGYDVTQEQRTYLGTAPPRVAPKIIALAKVAMREDPQSTAAQCVERALRTVMNGAEEFEAKRGQLTAAPRRPLLLSAALCNGLPVDAVYLAYRGLIKSLRHPADEQPALARAGFVDELRDVGVAVGIDAQRRIHFENLDFDSRALAYFWDGFPGLRKTLANWVYWSIKNNPLAPHDRALIAGRFAAQALRTNRPGDVTRLAEALVLRPARRENKPLVYLLLTIGLDSEHHASHFRRYLYEKAGRYPKAADSPRMAEYASILITLCTEHVARSHPEQAVTRLRLFAGLDGPVGDAASDALLRLAERDARVLRQLVGRIAKGPGRAPRRDADLFVAAITLDRATAARTAEIPRSYYAAGWHVVISADNAEALAGHLSGWLEPCLQRDPPGGNSAGGPPSETRYRILAEATKGAFALQSRLERAAYLWAAADDGDPIPRAEIAARLTYWIDRAAEASGGNLLYDSPAWKAA